MGDPRIIIDHLTGSRRGQRQDFVPGATIRFGRHPESDVSFHVHRDLDVSTRHAELRPHGSATTLRDVGSSNGTYVDGARIGEIPLAMGHSIVVELGLGGPKVRIYLGDPEHLPPPPSVSGEWEPLSTSYRLAVIGLAAFIVILAVGAWLMFV